MSLFLSCLLASYAPEGITTKQDPAHPSQRAEVGAVESAGRELCSLNHFFLNNLRVNWKNSRFDQNESKLMQHSLTMTVIWISYGKRAILLLQLLDTCGKEQA